MTTKNMGQPGLLKAINRNRIMKLVLQQGEISRASLAKTTKLALPSVMRLVDGLIDDGWLLDIGKGASSGGRKPTLLVLNKFKHYIIGVEIALETTVVLTDLSGDVLDKWQSGEKHDLTPELVMSKILEVLTQLIEKHQLTVEQVAGIGIGTPGSHFKHKRRISNTILKGWESIDVKKWFEEKTIYPIFVDNVARTKTLNELWFGKGKGLSDFIYILADQGVGCGIVKDNQIIEGFNGVAGEFGHTIISIDGKPCYCGNDGCLEMYVSTGAMLNQINEDADKNYETFEEAEHGIINHETLIPKTAKMLGIAVSNLINLINPEMVIIGGRVIEISEVMKQIVLKHSKDHIFSHLAESVEIIISDDDEVVNKGGVALVYNELFKSIV